MAWEGEGWSGALERRSTTKWHALCPPKTLAVSTSRARHPETIMRIQPAAKIPNSSEQQRAYHRTDYSL